MHMSRTLALLITCFLIASTLAAEELDERILHFNCEIHVNEDGTLKVWELIRVWARGHEIKRGIYRDLPTLVRDENGLLRKTPITITGVTHNGNLKAPHHTVRTNAGLRLYIGEEDVFIDPGQHIYQIDYVTERQIRHFEDYDELYWDVTGNEWSFPIDSVRCVVFLPNGASAMQYAAYTGKSGDKGKNFRTVYRGDERIVFKTLKGMPEGHGLTVAVAFPKGLVPEPTEREKLAQMALDNIFLLVAVLLLVGTLAYYIRTWVRIGIDPKRGLVIPRFEPPRGLSPGATAYVYNMGFPAIGEPKRAFAAALVNLAAKGRITVEEKKGIFTIRKPKVAK